MLMARSGHTSVRLRASRSAPTRPSALPASRPVLTSTTRSRACRASAICRSVRRMGHGLPRGAEVPGRPVWCIGAQPPPPPVSGTWGNSPSRAGGGSVIEEITEDWLASAMHAPDRDRPSPTAQDAGNRVRRPFAADRVPPPARSAAGSRPRHRRTFGDSRRLAAAWNQAVAGARLLARRPGAAPLRGTRPPQRRYRSARCRCALSP